MSPVLGLSFGIDSAAAMVVGSEVQSAAAQERFDRRKHSRAFPSDAMRFCLESAGLGLGELEQVGFFWNPAEHLRCFDPRRAMTYRDQREFLELVPSYLLGAGPDRGSVDVTEQVFHFGQGRRPLRVHYVAHHLCHAATAFYTSGSERAAVMTVDGYGENTSMLLARGDGTALTPLAQVRFPHSVGAVYAAVTEHLGFTPNCDEGKVMALAACAEPSFAADFERILRPIEGGVFEVDLSFFDYYRPSRSRCSDRFREVFGPARQRGQPLDERHAALAASLQARVEEILVHAARFLEATTGLEDLAMSGGVTLNTVANSRILDQTTFGRLFVSPPASDAGAALGAALYVAHAILGRPRSSTEYTDYLGPAYGDEEIRRCLTGAGAGWRQVEDPAVAAAARIAAGEIVGWFQGRMEFGPRALGNRSILADPRRAETKDRVNARVKHREPFRPFAPACTEESASAYFLGTLPSPHMMRTFRVVPQCAERLGAVTHVDGTARLQTVSESQNPLFHRLLQAMVPHLRMPVVLNTSFNDAGEPIVRTPAEALRCYASTGIDTLYLGNFELTKRPTDSAEPRSPGTVRAQREGSRAGVPAGSDPAPAGSAVKKPHPG